MTTSTATVRLADPRPTGARVVLAIGAGLSTVALAIAVLGLILDPAQITGMPAWMKPAKFAFSIAIYLLTMRWILSFVRGHARLLLVLSTGIVVGLVAEIALVELQVIRGTTSHYNEATDFDAGVFYAMGGIVTIVLIATIAAGVLALRQRGLDAGLAAGLRWGIAVCVLGMLAALTMIFNKGWNDSGGHTVGAADGGPGDADHRLEPGARRLADRALRGAARAAALAAARLGSAPIHAPGRHHPRTPAPRRGRDLRRDCRAARLAGVPRGEPATARCDDALRGRHSRVRCAVGCGGRRAAESLLNPDPVRTKLPRPRRPRRVRREGQK